MITNNGIIYITSSNSVTPGLVHGFQDCLVSKNHP